MNDLSLPLQVVYQDHTKEIDLLIRNAKLTSAHLRTIDVATANLIEMMAKELELKSSSFKTLYTAINNLLCHIGYEGSIAADHVFVFGAMCALKAIDGGVYGEQFAAVVVQPVAYRSALPSGNYTYCNTPLFVNAEPLYLASSLQERKPLSDAEITLIWREQIDTDGDYDTFARAIEEAHNIKGAA